MIQDFAGVFLELLCYFAYICMAGKFCKEYLEISQRNEKLFAVFGFCGGLLIHAVGQCYSIPNIALILLNHIFFIGLILLLFQRNTEKKILAASLLITATTLVENFCISIFSCFMLFWRHRVKNIAVPFLGERETNLIICVSFTMTIFVIYLGTQYLASVFYCKTGKWYILLAIPLLAITVVTDVANWGASNGILVRRGEIWGYIMTRFSAMRDFVS